MDQYQILDNLMDLYSEDEDVRLEALLAKKEWILDRFYVPYSLISTGDEEYTDLLALKNKALPFHKFTLKGITTKYLVNVAETFNKRFRRLKMYESLPSRSQRHIFYVQIDFRKLDKDDYKVLVPLFFYCLRKDVVSDVKLPNDIRKVIALAIEGQDNEAMQIVDIKHLEKNIMKVDGFKKIYAYDDMSEKELESVKDIAKYLHLPLVMVHAKNK